MTTHKNKTNKHADKIVKLTEVDEFTADFELSFKPAAFYLCLFFHLPVGDVWFLGRFNSTTLGSKVNVEGLKKEQK